MVIADTDAIAMGKGTYPSRLAANAGPAVHIAGGACTKIAGLAAHGSRRRM